MRRSFGNESDAAPPSITSSVMLVLMVILVSQPTSEGVRPSDCWGEFREFPNSDSDRCGMDRCHQTTRHKWPVNEKESAGRPDFTWAA